MNQFLIGLVLLIGLMLPPVANLMESVMIIHMHMQMPMLVIAGFFHGTVFSSSAFLTSFQSIIKRASQEFYFLSLSWVIGCCRAQWMKP